jgi:hypothetical protein
MHCGSALNRRIADFFALACNHDDESIPLGVERTFVQAHARFRVGPRFDCENIETTFRAFDVAGAKLAALRKFRQRIPSLPEMACLAPCARQNQRWGKISPANVATLT